ncbi:uncharacterized protein LOC126623385 isoform X2 [Malus sylvestris]|uniref:uncharacterized protein LOC126623385 isoform X2 n=1 Tax=Malus sylvestris TaxID=3752 RepID=UPI0021ACCF11|nr:uncharacterized protein LOC126623385 isoform X2 [Malus sylvestris]
MKVFKWPSYPLASHFSSCSGISLHSLPFTSLLPVNSFTPNSSPQNPISNLNLPSSQRSLSFSRFWSHLLGKFGNWKILNHILLSGNVSEITFSNINMSTRYYDRSWWGRAEPIYATTCPRHSKSNEEDGLTMLVGW